MTVIEISNVSCLVELNLLGKGDTDVIVEPPNTKEVAIGEKLIVVAEGTGDGGITNVQGGKQSIWGLGSKNMP